MRSSGSSSSSAMVSARGSRPRRRAVLERLVAPAPARDLRGELGRAPAGARGRPSAATSAAAVAAASPTTPASTGRCAPSASASRSTCATRAPGPTSAPWRVVHWFSAAPKATMTSDSREQPGGERRREAAGDAEVERVAARTARWRPPTWRAARRCARRARAAPGRRRRARRRGRRRAPAARRPRGARRARRRAGRGRGRAGAGGGGAATSAIGTRRPARRAAASARPRAARPRARRTARATSATAVAGPWTRSATAPTDAHEPVLVDAEVRPDRRRGRVGRERARAACGSWPPRSAR